MLLNQLANILAIYVSIQGTHLFAFVFIYSSCCVLYCFDNNTLHNSFYVMESLRLQALLSLLCVPPKLVHFGIVYLISILLQHNMLKCYEIELLKNVEDFSTVYAKAHQKYMWFAPCLQC